MSTNGTGPPNFVDLFIEQYKAYESPTSFWRWAAYSVIAATLRTKVYYRHGTSKLYPNVYVVFLADSAEYRKGAPIMAARSLIQLTKATKVFSGTASIQKILELLSQDIADRTSGIPVRGGAAIITADELASFFVEDKRLIPLLTDIWEPRTGDDIFEYSLRSGEIKIKDLCPSMLAASNETFLREVYDSSAVYGGLLGRTYMIKPDETRPPNSLMFMDNFEDFEKGKKQLVDKLQEIKKLSGPVTKTKDGAECYDKWYKELYLRYKTHPDRTGVLQRMHTNVLKLAIILACANYKLEITKEIFEEAILRVADLKQNYDLYVMSAGKSDLAEIATRFVIALMNTTKKAMSKKDFLMKNWGDVTAEDFDKMAETLRQAGIIEVDIFGSDAGYKMTPKAIEAYSKKVK